MSAIARTTRAIRRFARAASLPERCDLCAEPVPAEHDHVVDGEARLLRCACIGCALRFPTEGGAKLRRVTSFAERVSGPPIDDTLWARLGVPIGLAFFVKTERGPTARFPGAAGAVEAEIDERAWRELEEAIPSMAAMAIATEALLVRRQRESSEAWRVSVDRGFELVGRVRRSWTGMTGGDEVHAEIDRFFDELARGEPRR